MPQHLYKGEKNKDTSDDTFDDTSDDASDDNGGNINSDEEADESDGEQLQDKPETENTRGWSKLILQ